MLGQSREPNFDDYQSDLIEPYEEEDEEEDEKEGTAPKPRVRLSGENGNVFNLLAVCARALKRAGQRAQATELQERVFAAPSYDAALQLMMEYVDVE